MVNITYYDLEIEGFEGVVFSSNTAKTRYTLNFKVSWQKFIMTIS